MIDLEQAVRDTIYNPDGEVLMADFLEPLVARAFRTCMDCGVVVKSSSTMREHVLTGCRGTATTRLTDLSLGGIRYVMERPLTQLTQGRPPLLRVTVDESGYKLTVTPRDRFEEPYIIVCKLIEDLKFEITKALIEEERQSR